MNLTSSQPLYKNWISKTVNYFDTVLSSIPSVPAMPASDGSAQTPVVFLMRKHMKWENFFKWENTCWASSCFMPYLHTIIISFIIFFMLAHFYLNRRNTFLKRTSWIENGFIFQKWKETVNTRGRKDNTILAK